MVKKRNRFWQKLLVIISLVLLIGATSTYSAVELYPQKMPEVTVEASHLIDFIKLEGQILKVNEDSTRVQLIESLDAMIYSRQVNHLVRFPSCSGIDADWNCFVITGEKASFLFHKTHAYAWTDPASHVVVFLDVPGANRWMIMAHEFTHVLQVEDGTILFREKIYVEYQAEINSRFVIGLLEGFTLPDKLDTKPTSTVEEVIVLKYLTYFIN